MDDCATINLAFSAMKAAGGGTAFFKNNLPNLLITSSGLLRWIN